MSFDGYLHEQDAERTIKAMLPLVVLSFALVPLFGLLMIQVPIGMLLGLFLGYAITPDADHKAMTREEYRAMRKWGFLGALLVAYMTPYAYIFPHRSFWSHSIVGTVIRIAYVTLWLLAFALAIMSEIGLDFSIFLGYISMMFGWAIQDMIHYHRDRLGFLGLKRRRVDKRWEARF